VLIPHDALDVLARRLAAAGGGLRIAWVDIDLDPLDLVRAGSAAFASAAFYQPPQGRALAGLGTAWIATASGEDRFHKLEDRVGDLPSGAEVLVGFAFSSDGPTAEEWEGFPGATAVLPQVAVRRLEGRSRLIVAVPPGGSAGSLLSALSSLRPPGGARTHRGTGHRVRSIPSPEEWRDRVAEAIAAIRDGSVQKLVLARSVELATGAPIEPFEVVSMLRSRYPASRVLGWSTGARSFVGASPELLVSRRGRRFTTVPLAGSVRRGATPDEDRLLSDRLLSSEKDRAEHALVVEHVAERLRPLAATLDVPPGPAVQRYATVQHLATPIHGSGDATVWELIDALHPTPAVGGSPGSDALAFIEKVEGFDRGWYAGGIGWADPSGDGEVALSLRCALVEGDRARLYAGNGIVAGSSAAAELEETRLKLRPMLDLLTDS
jgi:isochorismate synthase